MSTATSIKVAPPNCLVFVSDRVNRKVPEITRGSSLWATSSCILIGCLAFMDGETEIGLGDVDEVGKSEPPALDRELETPFRTVEVSTSEGDVLLRRSVADVRTHIRVWTNHPTEPDKIVIGVRSKMSEGI